MLYRSEASFVRTFIRALGSRGCPLSCARFVREFSNGTSSRPDLILVLKTGEVVAIEAKLTRWRIAMQQAYRNTFFADRSYVLLPPKAAANAQRVAHEFHSRQIGICTIENGKISVLVGAPTLEPHNIYRRELAREHAAERRKR